MTPRSAGTFFARLIPSIISDLRRIASRSRGETTVEDLQTEAWLVAEELSRDRDPPPDAGDRGFQQQILGRLYNRFVNFADKHLRFATRIDEQREDDDGGTRENSIAAALAAPPEYEPSRAIEKQEDEHRQERQILGHFAEAVAYLRIFASMGNDRCAVADHLAIGAATLRRRIEHAEWTVKTQPSLFDGVTAIPDDFMPPRRNRLALVTTRTASRLPLPLAQFRLFVRAYIPIRRI
ncbi:hypothetical protein [Ralstonia sp. 24A2]|uniref:hypothetical protein n=1 Tax=Ralstonia sp. 24A2 TaxID=3447364 RepID=UPI003F697EAC